jgi:hypothetical protein
MIWRLIWRIRDTLQHACQPQGAARIVAVEDFRA